MENSSFGGYSRDFWAAKIVQLLILLGAVWAVMRLVERVEDPARVGGALLEHLLAFVVAAIGALSAGYFILNWDREVEDPLDRPRRAKPVAAAAASVDDDLTKIEGVGPKIAELLHAEGYESFEDIASADPDDLKAILEEAGPRFRMHETGTWPRQSRLAADGNWDKLEKLQDSLSAGRD